MTIYITVVTQDVGGLSELRWPRGSVIIQRLGLSVGRWNVCSNHTEQLLTTELEVLLNLNVLLQTRAGRRKSGQPPPSKDPDKVLTSALVSSLKS
jgi:hypothetical protein